MELRNFLIPGTKENWIGMVVLVAVSLLVIGVLASQQHALINKYNLLAERFNSECVANFSGGFKYNATIGGLN